MKSRTMITGIVGLLLLGSITFSFTGLTESETTEFTALHLVNLQSEDMEGEILAMMNDMNQALEEIGYPNIKYEVWKQRSNRDGRYSYLIQSTWPDQATYDKVHSHEKYQTTWDKHRSRYEELIAEDLYNRYIPLN